MLTGRPGDPIRVQYRVAATGELRWSNVRAYPVRDAHGELAHVINVFRDVTDDQREQARRRILLRAVDRFNASLDYDATLKTIAREMVGALADWCAVDILDGGELRRLAVEHVDPAKVALVEEIERRYPSDPAAPGSPRSVIESGKPYLVPVIADEMIRAAAKDASHLELIERLQLRSFLVAPMIGPSGPVGALTLAMAESRRVYSEDDVAYVSTLADRAASAIENARLVRAEKRAREMLERMESVIAAMSSATTRSEVAEVVCRIGGQAMGAQGAHLWLAQPDGGLTLAATWPGGDSMLEPFRHIPAGAELPAARVARGGEAEWIETERAFERAAPASYAAAKAAGRVSAFAVVPIKTPRKFKGVLSISHHLPHVYDAEERGFYTSLAQHCALALERARLLEDERIASEALARLNGVGAMFIAEPSRLEAVLREIVDTAIAIARSDFGNVQLLDASGLRIVAQRGFPSWWVDYWNGVSAGQGSCGTALERAERVVVEDVERSPIFAAAPALDAQRRAGVRAVVSIPVVGRSGGPLGIFSVHYRSPQRPGDRTLQMLEMLARQTADILERARADEANAAIRRELEQANRAKDEFLATMSHELRTPLNAILGWAKMLRRDASDPAKVQRGIDVIERNAQSQTKLVSDLLDVSRIISGKLRLSTRKVAPSAAIYAAADVVRPACEAKGVRLVLDLDPDLGMTMADPDRLQQVVWNLLSNAVRFTPAGGRVTVTANRDGARIVIRVQDTGSGIAAEHLAHIFERFRQIVSSTTRSHGGLGLGLAIVRHLVEAHGGNVVATSEGIGRGATFTVTLPIPAVNASTEPDIDRAGEVDAPDAQAAARRAELKDVRALVVDDDADSLELLRVLLEDAGAEVTTAPSARAALAARGPFDIIVSDIGMPETDGYALMRQIRSGDAGARTPAIALTAYARTQDADYAARSGYQEHLAKPVDVDALIDAVKRWTRWNAATPPSTRSHA